MRGAVLLRLLCRPFEAGEIERLEDAVRDLEARLASLDPAALARESTRFADARLVASLTLTRGEGRDGWLRANDLVGAFVTEERQLDLDRIRELAGALAGLGPGELAPLRAGPASFSGFIAPAADEIEALLAPMPMMVRERIETVHPIAGAALAQQWLVSVHPFADANGRTGRLVADWLLASAGFPPATYSDSADAITTLVAHDDPDRAPARVVAAADVLVRGLANTLALLRC